MVVFDRAAADSVQRKCPLVQIAHSEPTIREPGSSPLILFKKGHRRFCLRELDKVCQHTERCDPKGRCVYYELEC